MEMKKKQRYLAGVGAVVLLGAVVYVMATAPKAPTDNPTATSTDQVATTTDIFAMEPIIPEAKVSTEGWKTCRNEEYGYEFKFPAEWHIYGEDALGEPIGGKRSFVRESKECNGVTVSFSKTKIGGYPKNIESEVGIYVYRPDSTFPFSDLYTFFDHKRDKAIAQSYWSVDSHNALLQIYTGYSGEDWYLTIWATGDVYQLGGKNYTKDQQVVDTILSTFYFLDTATTTQE